MALINCPECGQKISDKAKACIHCGYPLVKEETSYDNHNSMFATDYEIAMEKADAFEEFKRLNPWTWMDKMQKL